MEKKKMKLKVHLTKSNGKTGFFFFQNNIHFQTNSLVGNISKLFKKLTSQV